MSISRPSHLHSWYAVHCKPLKERYAALALEEQLGLTVYLPEVRRYFRKQVRQAPLFPCYLFVRASLQIVPLSRINATPGVLGVVTVGGAPQSVPSLVLEELYQRVNALNAQGGLQEHGFLPGGAVRLKAGPLQGMEAIFMGPMEPTERVRVLIDFLGCLRETEVDLVTLEHANSGPTHKLERRTRGKGRFIKRH